MREIAFDTETTGLSPDDGHRIIELGCVEMVDKVRTGRSFQRYLNPQRHVSADAEAIHGIGNAFLADKPLFSEIVEDFLAFIGDAPLVIHNAGFDMKFLNAEFARVGFAPFPMTRAVDTVQLARRKFPGAPASLDALCKRYLIDLSGRSKHGALLDAELLADVYLELCGGRQAAIVFEETVAAAAQTVDTGGQTPLLIEPRVFAVSGEELAAHQAFLTQLKKPIWEEAE